MWSPHYRDSVRNDARCFTMEIVVSNPKLVQNRNGFRRFVNRIDYFGQAIQAIPRNISMPNTLPNIRFDIIWQKMPAINLLVSHFNLTIFHSQSNINESTLNYSTFSCAEHFSYKIIKSRCDFNWRGRMNERWKKTQKNEIVKLNSRQCHSTVDTKS